MNKTDRYANLATVIGIVAGGMAWMVVLGFVLNVPLVSMMVILLGTVIIMIAVRLLSMYAHRRLSILGALIFLVIIFNLLSINKFYSRIPSSVCGMTTGKESISPCSISALLMLFGIAGLAMIVIDVVKKRK